MGEVLGVKRKEQQDHESRRAQPGILNRGSLSDIKRGLQPAFYSSRLTLYADGVPRNRSNIFMSDPWIKGRRSQRAEV